MLNKNWHLLVKKVNITKFDDFSTYAWVHSESYNLFERFLIRKTLKKNSPDGEFAVDIGCGAGLVLEEMCRIYDYCVGVDISRGILRHAKDRLKAKEKLNIDLLCADVEYMPFKNSVFDVTAMYSVLHHLPDPNSSLKEINRTMRSESVMILFHEPNEVHVRELTEKTLNKIMRNVRYVLFWSVHRRKWQHFWEEALRRSAKLGKLENLADVHGPKGFSVLRMKMLFQRNGFKVIEIKTRMRIFMATFSRLCWPYKLIATLDLIISEVPILSNYLPSLLCIAKKACV